MCPGVLQVSAGEGVGFIGCKGGFSTSSGTGCIEEKIPQLDPSRSPKNA